MFSNGLFVRVTQIQQEDMWSLADGFLFVQFSIIFGHFILFSYFAFFVDVG